jgi:hypothetical protein
MVFSCGKGAGAHAPSNVLRRRGIDDAMQGWRVGAILRPHSESDLAGAQGYDTRTPQVFYLFVVETLNMGFDVAMMDQLLVMQYGASLPAFSSDHLIHMRTQASN